MGSQQVVTTIQLLGARGLGNLTSPLIVGIRHLGINRNGLATGQMHHHIRPEHTTVGIGHHHLGVKVNVLQQSRGLHNILQLRLAPGTTNLIVAQCRG